MRQLILYTAISLDGYIADPNSGTDWIFIDEDYGFEDFKKGIDTAMMGRHTHETLRNSPQMTNATFQQIVFTAANSTESESASVRFMSADFAVGYTQSLKNQSGKDIWLIGGGRLNALMLEANMIDALVLLIHPICLGDGIRLFEGHSFTKKFALQSCMAQSSGILKVHYSSKK